MKVPIDAVEIWPWTLLVARALATTLPADCWRGGASGIRSSKLVSVRL